MTTVRHHASMLRITSVSSSQFGVLCAEFTGPITREIYDQLRPKMLQLVADAPAIVIRVDRAMFAWQYAEQMPRNHFIEPTPAAAVIASRADFAMFTDIAQQVATAGVIRVIFLETEMEAALEWAEDWAMLQLRRGSRPSEAALERPGHGQQSQLR